MVGQRNCDAMVTAGRLSKANEFFDAAEHLGEESGQSQRGRCLAQAGRAAEHLVEAAKRAAAARG